MGKDKPVNIARFSYTEVMLCNFFFFDWFLLTSNTDIDECQSESYCCHAQAQCVNVAGSYNRTCLTDYAGEGQNTCQGLCFSRSPSRPGAFCFHSSPSSISTKRESFKSRVRVIYIFPLKTPLMTALGA